MSAGRRLVLVRHGRTAHNADGRIQGQLDIALDPTGVDQARAVGDVLAAVSPVLLLSSDLRRAVDTAAPIARATGLVPVLDARLRELHLGTWQGLTGEQVRETHPEEHAAWRAGQDVARGGGETYRAAGERASEALLEHLAGVPAGGTVVAVTHGGTARAALGVLLGLPDATWGRLAPLGNACWSQLLETDRGWRLERHNTGLGAAVGPVVQGPFEAPARPGSRAS